MGGVQNKNLLTPILEIRTDLKFQSYPDLNIFIDMKTCLVVGLKTKHKTHFLTYSFYMKIEGDFIPFYFENTCIFSFKFFHEVTKNCLLMLLCR